MVPRKRDHLFLGRFKGIAKGTGLPRKSPLTILSFDRQRRFLSHMRKKAGLKQPLFWQDRKEWAVGDNSHLRRIRNAPPEASHAIRRKKTPPFWGFFYAQSYPHVDVDCLQIFCLQLRNRCFTKLPVDRSDFRAHLPVDK